MCGTEDGSDNCQYDVIGRCSGDGRTQGDCEQYATWEKKPDVDKTWVNAKTTFKIIKLDNDAYKSNIRGTAKRGRYESMANVEEEEDD